MRPCRCGLCAVHLACRVCSLVAFGGAARPKGRSSAHQKRACGRRYVRLTGILPGLYVCTVFFVRVAGIRSADLSGKEFVRRGHGRLDPITRDRLDSPGNVDRRTTRRGCVCQGAQRRLANGSRRRLVSRLKERFFWLFVHGRFHSARRGMARRSWRQRGTPTAPGRRGHGVRKSHAQTIACRSVWFKRAVIGGEVPPLAESTPSSADLRTSGNALASRAPIISSLRRASKSDGRFAPPAKSGSRA